MSQNILGYLQTVTSLVKYQPVCGGEIWYFDPSQNDKRFQISAQMTHSSIVPFTLLWPLHTRGQH